jgi:N6-adenosine-specific RNA methylase IME4
MSMMYSLDRIRVGENRRAVVEATVLALMQSIREIGLLHPITVQKIGDEIHLVAGRNRLEAYKRLGTWDKIPAVLIEVSARIAELDENLCRGNLSEVEEARAVRERKQLYEERHPETKLGGMGISRPKKVGQDGQPIESHAANAARLTGQSERTIRRKVKLGQELSDNRFDRIIGTCLDSGDELDALVQLKNEAPEELEKLISQVVEGKKVSASARLKQIKRTKTEAKLAAKIVALPDKQYGVIVTDPEWKDTVWSEETGMDRHASNHYPTSDAAVIAARPVAKIAARDCVLFMWTTNQHLRIALGVMEAWGFEYRSNYCWAKDKLSTGRWNRSTHELLLIGTRGKPPCPAPGTQWESMIIKAPKGEHSAKPECFLEMIEGYYPTMPKIELNRRGPPRPGWDAWGYEVQSNEAA